MDWAMRLAGSDDDDPQDDDQQESEFAHERELRDEAEHEPLGGADLDHCGRMRG
jgi:hypothetical protein